MAEEDITLSICLWREKSLEGMSLLYLIQGKVPVEFRPGGSCWFPSDHAVNEALIGAHISPSLAASDERAATVYGVKASQLERLGFEPRNKANRLIP